ncbi:MAG TPA: flagellar basal body rod protein FlgB [Acidobacteriaceae bacterium]
MASAPLIPASLERFLELTTDRQQIVSSNMANIDTPGYRTRDLNFQHELARASSGLDEAQGLQPAVQQVQGLLERPDGNNVDLDRESLLLAQTQLQYSMGVQLVKSEFHQLLSAINGGN